MRLFFALWPGDETVAALSAVAEEAARRWGGRPMRPETLHLTLAFLGEIEPGRLNQAEEAADGIDAKAFDFSLDRLGYWPHNHIFWAGCTRREVRLQGLAQELGDRLRERGFALERRSFSPHVTLVRKMAAAPQPLPDLPACRWHCGEFTLVRSLSAGSGVEYQKLASWKLG
ncbi:MAG: 2'-5'-RNA ligase [Betaproteobacteria bacterium ADurb.Bin341]|nr:MAG: 2'-5'-RNA ligase [Betaproteobacteria bacterium ADurb.Bin341]